MKKFLFFAFFSIFLSLSLCAQTSATLFLRGVVLGKIDISSTIVETNIINLSGSQSMMLGSIFLSSNTTNGYSVTIMSRNGGVMKSSASGEAEALPYSLNFGGIDGIDLSNSFQLSFASNGDMSGTEYPLMVNFPGIDSMNNPLSPGVYEDIVTITISVT